MKDKLLNKQLLRSFLLRQIEKHQAVLDAVPVFSKRYNTAVDALEEAEQLLDELITL